MHIIYSNLKNIFLFKFENNNDDINDYYCDRGDGFHYLYSDHNGNGQVYRYTTGDGHNINGNGNTDNNFLTFEK